MAMALNEHHDSAVLNYLRYARFERNQCIKSVRSCFADTKDTRLLDTTFTVDEVEDLLSDLANVVCTEIEAELLHSAHTNVLLLQQLFAQAEKWHLNLDVNLAELENRELLDRVKSLEERECQQSQLQAHTDKSQKIMLAPLHEQGPMPLLNLQIQRLQDDNESLRSRLKDLESQSLALIERNQELQQSQAACAQDPQPAQPPADQDQRSEVEQLSEAFKAVKVQMASELERSALTQQHLQTDLTDTKHQLLDIQHQLTMAEKELEKKFSETGAYKNMKRLLQSKNDQIKELRIKLKAHNPDLEDSE